MLTLELLEQRRLLSISSAGLHPAELAGTLPGADVVALGTSAAVANVVPTAAAIASVRAGLWSDATTWSGGHVPGPDDDVVISHNVTIDNAQARQIEINAGTATLAGDLHAHGSVIVRGRLEGTHGAIYFHVADDRLFTGNTVPGPDPSMPDFHPEDTGLWVLGGASIDLQGEAVTSWLNAVGSGAAQPLGNGVSQQVSFRAGSATLQSAPVGWRVGDKLLLVNERGQSRAAELLTVSGAAITYRELKSTPAQPDLVGHSLSAVGSTVVVQSKIANLSRRVQIVSADVAEGDTDHRAHTIYMDGASANLVNVEFRDLGPRAKLGRYPVHFHHGDEVAVSLIGSSIWQDVTEPGNRFVALHGIQGAMVKDNVAWRSRGNGFFMEDGHEFDNSIIGNLSVDVTGGEELPLADSDVTELSHHYWLRVGNTIAGNVAAGGDSAGMIILEGHAHGTTVVQKAESLGAGIYGIWTGAPNVTFENPVAVFNERAGFAGDPAWDVDTRNVTLNNPLLLFNGTDDSSYGSQIYLNNGSVAVNGGVLAGDKAIHTHYHSSFVMTGSKIDVNTLQTPTYWEMSGIFDQATIRTGALFDRAYPTPRYVSPGTVRLVATSLQVGSGPAAVKTTDFMGNIHQNYPTLPGKAIPNGIELNQPAPASGFLRVTMLPDAERWREPIVRWIVTPIGQAEQHDYFIYERQSVWTQLAPFGGYPEGLPPGQYAVKLYDENGLLRKQGFAVIRSGIVSDLQDTLENQSQVVARRLFYNNSKYDGYQVAAGASDDLAIATDKVAYQSNGAMANFANVSSYAKGINGIAIDLAGPHGAITAADFTFKVGANNVLTTWAAAPTPLSVIVRAGAGAGGSDRVEIVWADRAIINQWLQVTMLSNARTGLAVADTFYFGSRVGDSGEGNSSGSATTNAVDETAARNHPAGQFPGIAVTNRYDYNRDGQVNAADQLLARRSAGSLAYLQLATAQSAAVGEAAVAAIAGAMKVSGRSVEPEQHRPFTFAANEPPALRRSVLAKVLDGSEPTRGPLSTGECEVRLALIDDALLDALLEGRD